MKTRLEIASKARTILRETAERCPLYASKLNGIAVEVSGRMTNCAGKAFYSRNLIKLSFPFYADDTNFEQDLFNTVTHEAAHLVIGLNGRNRQPHSLEWQLVHRSMGGNGKRCHTLELADGFRKRKQYEVACGTCGQPIKLGATRYRRHQQSLAIGGKGYRHSTCPSTRSVL